MGVVICCVLVGLFAAVPTVADSCIYKSAVCCMVGQIEGKIFFDEIEGPGCSNRGHIQVIFNLIGFPSQGYENESEVPFYHFRLKTYGEIIPACSGVGPDYGYRGGHVATAQPFEDGSIYNDTVFLPLTASGQGTEDLIGRAAVVYEGHPENIDQNESPLACCVIGRGQPVTLPSPSPTSPTHLGSGDHIDLTLAQQTKDRPSLDPIVLKENAGKDIEDIDTNSNNYNVGNFRLLDTDSARNLDNDDDYNVNKNQIIENLGHTMEDNNLVYENKNGNGIANPSNLKIEKGLSLRNEFIDMNKLTGNRKQNSVNQNNPKYELGENEIDKKFDLIGGYGGGSNFGLESYQPNRNDEHANGISDTRNNGNRYSNIFNAGNNNYNANTADAFGTRSSAPGRNFQFSPPTNPRAGYPLNSQKGNSFENRNSYNNGNDNRNSFINFNDDNHVNRNSGFGSSQFPSVFGSIGSGNFFNLDGKLAGAAIVNRDPESSTSLIPGVKGGLGSSLTKGFEPPKGPTFQDIYNKPTGESPLSSGGFADTVSPEKENSISRLFFSDPQIKETIGLSTDDKFIPRETEDEEESVSYRSNTNSDDANDEIGDDFGSEDDNNNPSSNTYETRPDDAIIAPSPTPAKKEYRPSPKTRNEQISDPVLTNLAVSQPEL